MNRVKNSLIIPILFPVFYVVYFYLINQKVIELNMMVSINNVSVNNLLVKLINDFLVMLLIPLILIVAYRRKLCDLNFHFLKTYLQYVLLAILIMLFFLHADFTIDVLILVFKTPF
jgi:hypothetical protein